VWGPLPRLGAFPECGSRVFDEDSPGPGLVHGPMIHPHHEVGHSMERPWTVSPVDLADHLAPFTPTHDGRFEYDKLLAAPSTTLASPLAFKCLNHEHDYKSPVQVVRPTLKTALVERSQFTTTLFKPRIFNSGNS